MKWGLQWKEHGVESGMGFFMSTITHDSTIRPLQNNNHSTRHTIVLQTPLLQYLDII